MNERKKCLTNGGDLLVSKLAQKFSAVHNNSRVNMQSKMGGEESWGELGGQRSCRVLLLKEDGTNTLRGTRGPTHFQLWKNSLFQGKDSRVLGGGVVEKIKYLHGKKQISEGCGGKRETTVKWNEKRYVNKSRGTRQREKEKSTLGAKEGLM